MTTNTTKVGFIGLGNMGGPMAANIAKAGFPLSAFDRRSEALSQLEAAGGMRAASVAELARECDIVCTCVLYDHQVRDIFLGDGGLIQFGKPGLVATIHSTVLPETVRRIADEAAKRGIAIVDAPVSGGNHGSRCGTLAMAVGTDDQSWVKVKPILDVVASKIVRVGQVGDGQVAKLANNIMALGNLIVALEATRFSSALGLSGESMLAYARVASGGSYAIDNYEHYKRYGHEHTLAGTPELPHRFGKDLRYAVAVAQEKWTYLPVTALCSQLLPALFEEHWRESADK